MMTSLRLILFSIFVFSSHFAVANDKNFCLRLIPPDLALQLTQSYPSYVLPSEDDLDPETILWYKEKGNRGCYAVARGKFGGAPDGFAVLLKPDKNDAPKKNDGLKLVVALKSGRSWKLSQLDSFCEYVKYCYVGSVKAGRYTRTESADGPLNSINEREAIISRHTNVQVGVVASTGIVYVLTNGRWNYVLVEN